MLFKQDSNEADAHAQLTGEHEPRLSHELIAGAASYKAAKAYENHLRTHGKPANHANTVELLAGFTGAFIDWFAETKGLDAFDRERAKRDAKEKIGTALDQSNQY